MWQRGIRGKFLGRELKAFMDIVFAGLLHQVDNSKDLCNKNLLVCHLYMEKVMNCKTFEQIPEDLRSYPSIITTLQP